jgi:hypothetical protein
VDKALLEGETKGAQWYDESERSEEEKAEMSRAKEAREAKRSEANKEAREGMMKQIEEANLIGGKSKERGDEEEGEGGEGGGEGGGAEEGDRSKERLLKDGDEEAEGGGEDDIEGGEGGKEPSSTRHAKKSTGVDWVPATERQVESDSPLQWPQTPPRVLRRTHGGCCGVQL